MKLSLINEHNGEDTLLWVVDYPGAYTRGASLAEAVEKMPKEIAAYCRWAGLPFPEYLRYDICDFPTELNVRDADSDVIFPCEKEPLTIEEYARLRDLCLRSARDFLALYESVPAKNIELSPARRTFYGEVPTTAEGMYLHTKNVNEYYFGEINVSANNEGTILDCRLRGFETLESTSDYLNSRSIDGSYGEIWSTRKLLRRFIWHDRIHGRAMYRRAASVFGEGGLVDPFGFGKTTKE